MPSTLCNYSYCEKCLIIIWVCFCNLNYISDINYFSSLSVAQYAPASAIKTGLSALCDKLDVDLGGAYFATIKTAINFMCFPPV